MTLSDAQLGPPNPQSRETERPATAGFRVQTGLRAGDLYMQSPRGSNNRLNGGG